jgi:hypothetical protein
MTDSRHDRTSERAWIEGSHSNPRGFARALPLWLSRRSAETDGVHPFARPARPSVMKPHREPGSTAPAARHVEPHLVPARVEHPRQEPADRRRATGSCSPPGFPGARPGSSTRRPARTRASSRHRRSAEGPPTGPDRQPVRRDRWGRPESPDLPGRFKSQWVRDARSFVCPAYSSPSSRSSCSSATLCCSTSSFNWRTRWRGSSFNVAAAACFEFRDARNRFAR